MHSLLFLFSTLLSAPAAAEPQLYDTGPPEEAAAYVRFVNASGAPVTVQSFAGGMTLDASGDGRVSRFYRIRAGAAQSATVERAGVRWPVEVTGKPWEYLTIALVGSHDWAETLVIRETPIDLHALRASLSLFNLDSACAQATMRADAQGAPILEGVAASSVGRRLVNPIMAAVTVTCDGTEVQVPLPALEPGGRYSVFLAPGGAAQSAFAVRDAD
jgi:hypothetical protein